MRATDGIYKVETIGPQSGLISRELENSRLHRIIVRTSNIRGPGGTLEKKVTATGLVTFFYTRKV